MKVEEERINTFLTDHVVVAVGLACTATISSNFIITLKTDTLIRVKSISILTLFATDLTVNGLGEGRHLAVIDVRFTDVRRSLTFDRIVNKSPSFLALDTVAKGSNRSGSIGGSDKSVDEGTVDTSSPGSSVVEGVHGVLASNTSLDVESVEVRALVTDGGGSQVIGGVDVVVLALRVLALAVLSQDHLANALVAYSSHLAIVFTDLAREASGSLGQLVTVVTREGTHVESVSRLALVTNSRVMVVSVDTVVVESTDLRLDEEGVAVHAVAMSRRNLYPSLARVAPTSSSVLTINIRKEVSVN